MPTPTGNPAWVRTNDHSAYGGNVNKTNYEGVGTVNPRTDLSAENLCRIAADLAAIGRTAPFAILRFTCDDTLPGNPTVDAYSAMAGGNPSGARNGNGDVTFTWSTSYSDPYSVPGAVHFQFATATVLGSSSCFATVTLLDPNLDGKNEAIQVRIFDDTGAAAQNKTAVLVVFTGSL